MPTFFRSNQSPEKFWFVQGPEDRSLLQMILVSRLSTQDICIYQFRSKNLSLSSCNFGLKIRDGKSLALDLHWNSAALTSSLTLSQSSHYWSRVKITRIIIFPRIVGICNVCTMPGTEKTGNGRWWWYGLSMECSQDPDSGQGKSSNFSSAMSLTFLFH